MTTQLDHLYGRTVVAAEVIDADNQWLLRLDGDALIRNYDDQIDPPVGAEGLVVLSSSEDAGTVTVQLGYSGAEGATVVQEISLSSDQYEIVAPGDEPEQPVVLPDDPSPDRVADGPAQKEAAGAQAQGQTTP